MMDNNKNEGNTPFNDKNLLLYCTIQNKLSNNIPSSLHLINQTQILVENEFFLLLNFTSSMYGILPSSTGSRTPAWS